ncbi:unnamed protein product, partial [Ectocarpus fasciculatus]
RLDRQDILGRVIQRAARSRTPKISAFWRWRLATATAAATATATKKLLGQQEREGSIGRGAVATENAPRRRDAGAEPAATAAKAAVTTLAAVLRTQPGPAASDEARQEEVEPALSTTRTAVVESVHLFQQEGEKVHSQREGENARAKASRQQDPRTSLEACTEGSSREAEGLRMAQEDAKQVTRLAEAIGIGADGGGGGDGGD